MLFPLSWVNVNTKDRYGVKTVDLQTTWAHSFGSLYALVNIMTADPDLPLPGCSALIPVLTSLKNISWTS